MAVINFTPIYGVQSNSPCCCYLLEVDDVCILLDCGWTELYDEEMLQPLKRVISRIDLVLISHPDLAHMGALPYAVGTLGLKAPIYGTLPIYRMGQITMYDAYQAITKTSEFDLFNLDHIDAVFENFKQLKYSEKLTLTSSGEGIVITPHNAGHLIGGSIWRIVKETEEIIYAVDYNHRTEHVLSKSVLDTFSRPTLLITDSMNIFTEQPKMRERDSRIMESILSTLRNNGNVLIPCDSAGRVLEIMRVLDQYWIQNKLRDPIALLHDMSYYVAKAAQAMLEWCNERITKNFDIGRQNPFQFTNINLLHSLEDLEKLKSPRVVLATSQTLECGFAKELFIRWANNPVNRIIFTCRPPENSLSWRILRNIETQATNLYELQITKQVPLEGQELAAHQASERRKAQAEAEKRAKEEEESAMEKMILGMDDYDSDSGNENENENENQDLNGADSHARFRVGFGQYATPKFPMFSFMEKKSQWDEYGEVIDAEHYMDKAAKLRQRRKNDALLQMDDDPMDIDEENPANDEELVGEDVPTKTVHRQVNVILKAQVSQVNFEGVADGRSIQNCIFNVKPRKLILIHGTEETTQALKEYATQNLSNNTVFTPKALECVDIESDTNIYRLQLRESLYTSMDFQVVGGHEVAYLDAQMHFPSDQSVPILQQLPADPATKATKQMHPDGHEPILLSEGNVKLDILRQFLANAGFVSQFRGGMLVCQDGVILKRTKSNSITIEGVLSENYFKIRALLYDQFTLV